MARHVVKTGENFWTIARYYYGTGRYYKALWAANRDRVEAPDRLVVGMTVTIPPVGALDRSLVDPPATPRADPAAAAGSWRTSRPSPARPGPPPR